MNKDKIVKISIVFSIIFAVFGFLIVKAANTITLKAVSNSSYVNSSSEKDVIDGKYFDKNNVLVINYTILDGFSKITDSALKVRITSDVNYDENMMNSCIRVLYPGEYADTFQLAINYKNYLDFIETDTSLSGGDTSFPTKFNLEVYTNIGGDERIVATREVSINTSFDGSRQTEINLSPYGNVYADTTIPYTYLEEFDDYGTEGYNIDTVMGSWEDNKYYVFNYNIFDNSLPKRDIRPYSTDANYVKINPVEANSPVLKAYLASKIGDTDLSGLKLVLEFDRTSSLAMPKKTYKYELRLMDIYGNEYVKILSVNYLQYKRFVYDENSGDSSLQENSIVKENNLTYKASSSGELNLNFSTSFVFDGLSLLDSDLNDITDESKIDVSGSNRIKTTFRDLKEGRYTILFYCNYDENNPAASYSFYFEPYDVTTVDTVYTYGNGTVLQDVKDYNEVYLNKSYDYVLIDRVSMIGDRKLEGLTNYELGINLGEQSSYHTGFDKLFGGLLCLDTTEFESFIISVDSNEAKHEYILKPIVTEETNEFEITLTLSNDKVALPEKDQRTIIATPIITRNGEVVSVPYSYEIYQGNVLTNPNYVFAEIKSSGDVINILPGAEKGKYTVKVSLNDYDVSVSKTFSIVDKSDISDLIVEITNGNNIKIPSEGHRTDVELKTRITRDGKVEDGKGTFVLANSVEGVSLQGSTLSVKSNAKEGDKVVVNFSYEGASTSKTFTLVKDGSGEGTEVSDDTPTVTPTGTPDDSNKTFSSIVFSGFDSDRSQVKVLTFDDNSGTYKDISYKCYDENGNEIKNPIIEISGGKESEGILVEPNYEMKTVRIYANGLYGANKNFYINVTSKGSSILSLPVVAAKPDEYDCYIEFETNSIVKNSSFTTDGVFVNYEENPVTVSLVTVIYDKNNKIVDKVLHSQTVNKFEEKAFKTRLLMPADVNNIKVKSFFINGDDLNKANRFYTYSKTITNRGGVN